MSSWQSQLWHWTNKESLTLLHLHIDFFQNRKRLNKPFLQAIPSLFRQFLLSSGNIDGSKHSMYSGMCHAHWHSVIGQIVCICLVATQYRVVDWLLWLSVIFFFKPPCFVKAFSYTWQRASHMFVFWFWDGGRDTGVRGCAAVSTYNSNLLKLLDFNICYKDMIILASDNHNIEIESIGFHHVHF